MWGQWSYGCSCTYAGYILNIVSLSRKSSQTDLEKNFSLWICVTLFSYLEHVLSSFTVTIYKTSIDLFVQEPVLPGCFLRAKAIGLMPMIDQVTLKQWKETKPTLHPHSKQLLTKLLLLIQGEKDDKIIAVCADDPEYKHYTDIKELPPHRLSEIRRFFEDCILYQIYYKVSSINSSWSWYTNWKFQH